MSKAPETRTNLRVSTWIAAEARNFVKLAVV